MINRKAVPNPFDSDVVTDPDSSWQTDVPRIHEEVFLRCRQAFTRVTVERRSWSVLLHGEAGCGKTHLLSRFRKWLAGELEPKPGVPAGLFVAVRMETGPGHVWRHLRRRFAEELLRRGPDGSPRLDAILNRYASRNGGNLPEAFDNAPVRDLGHDLIRILESFSAGRERRLCRAWLAGDGISESDLATLNLAQPSFEGIDEDVAEYDARRVIEAITRLAAPSPVVFCFDQMEALALSQQTRSFGAFSRMGASLIDETENALLISTILTSFLKELQNGSTLSDYQRISKDRADLLPLNQELGRQLLEARLALVPELENENPLRESDLTAFYQSQHGQVTPRRLIHEARRWFELWQGKPEKPPISADDFLRAEFEQLWNDSEVRTQPRLADDILAHGLPVAFGILGRPAREKPAKNIDLATGSGSSQILVGFGNHTNMRSLGSWLKKLQQNQPPGSVLCVVRDQRLPITKTARVAQQRLREIQQTGGRVVRVDAEALAALDAMRHLLSRATSGDLSLNGEPAAPQTVREWLARNLPEGIGNLAQEILGERIAPPPPDALLELLERRKVLPLAEAARLTEMSWEQIEDYARTHPNRIGLFGGACPVVCQAIAPPAQGEASGIG